MSVSNPSAVVVTVAAGGAGGGAGAAATAPGEPDHSRTVFKAVPSVAGITTTPATAAGAPVDGSRLTVQDKLSMSLDDIDAASRKQQRGGRGKGGRGKGKRGGRSGPMRRDRNRPDARPYGEHPSGRDRFKHMGHVSVQDIAKAPSSQRVLKTSGQSRPQKVAGSIAHITRAGEPPTVVSIGASSINQAVKALIIARRYLEDDNLDFVVHVENRTATATDAVAFVLTKQTGVRRSGAGGEQELKVAGHGDVSSVAGAIAGMLRENTRVATVSVGADSIKQAVKAIAMARQFLTKDGLDIAVRPESIDVDMDKGTRKAIKLCILAQQV